MEDRVAAAEARIQALELKLKEISMKPKCRKAHLKKCFEEQAKSNLKKKLANIITVPPASLPETLKKEESPAPAPAPVEPQVETPKKEETPEPQAETVPCSVECPVAEIAAAVTLKPEPVEEEEPTKTEEPKTEQETESPIVSQLVSMGFDKTMVRNVVEVYKDIESALEHLLNNL
jgi:hypothetical protein